MERLSCQYMSNNSICLSSNKTNRVIEALVIKEYAIVKNQTKKDHVL